MDNLLAKIDSQPRCKKCGAFAKFSTMDRSFGKLVVCTRCRNQTYKKIERMIKQSIGPTFIMDSLNEFNT